MSGNQRLPSAMPSPTPADAPTQSLESDVSRAQIRSTGYKKSAIVGATLSSVLADLDPRYAIGHKAIPGVLEVCNGIVTELITHVLESRPADQRGEPISVKDITNAMQLHPSLKTHTASIQPITGQTPARIPLHEAFCQGDRTEHRNQLSLPLQGVFTLP